MPNYGGKGTQLQVTVNSTFVAVGQIVEFTGPSGEMGTREVTHLDSSAREFAPTIVDSGELSGTLLYDPTNTAARAIESNIYTGSPSTGLAMKVVFSTTTRTMTFTGIPTAWGFTGFNVDGTASADFGVKLTGALTLPTTT
jgi:hypothetical protein